MNKSKTKLYQMWGNMKQRCYNPNSSGYKYYGGMGVTVCDEWVDNFDNFERWAKLNGYKDGLTIDKDFLCDKFSISPKIYSPKTCIFIDKYQNSKLGGENTNGFSYIEMANYYGTTTMTLRNWRNGTDGQKRRYDALYKHYKQITKEEEK